MKYEDYLEFSRNADLLIHDAEFTIEEYNKRTKQWGHSTYNDALQLAMDANVKQFGLFHHNQDRTDEKIDAVVEQCKKIINDNNVVLECFAIEDKMEIRL